MSEPSARWTTSAKVWVAALALVAASLTVALIQVSLELRDAEGLDVRGAARAREGGGVHRLGGSWVNGACVRDLQPEGEGLFD